MQQQTGPPQQQQRLAGLTGNTLPPFRTLPTNPIPSPYAPQQNALQEHNTGGVPKLGSAHRSARPAPTAPLYRSADAAPAIKRSRKRRAVERGLNPRLENVVPESKVYSQLVDCERRVDSLLDARRSDVQEALQAPERARKRLRVYLHSSYANQGEGGVEAGCWVLRISGRLLEYGVEGGGKLPGRRRAFSTFVKRLDVQLDPDVYPGTAGRVRWEKGNGGGEGKDSFEIRRVGNRAVKAVVKIELDDQVPKYRLMSGLAAVLGVETATRAHILSSLWIYITVNKLQMAGDASTIVCDEALRTIFGGVQSVPIASLSQRLGELLSPCDAVTLEYTVQVSGHNPSHPAAYDVDVELPVTPNLEKLAGYLEKISKEKDIAALNQKISMAVQKIDEHRRRRAFFMGFAHSPVDFINAILVSQSKDLRDARASGGQDFEVDRRTDVFKGRWVEDAVVKYLQRRLAGGH